jgi:hypothetical protein
MNIPLYGQEVAPVQAIQAPVLSPGQAAAPALSVAKVGQDVMELGAHIQSKIDEVRRTEELSKRALQVESETADLIVSLDQKKDPATVAEDFANGFQEIKERALEGVNDMKVANALTSHLAQREATDTVKVKHQSWAWTVEQGQESVQADTDQMIQNHTRSLDVATPDPETFAKAAEDIRVRINASVESGILKPEVGRALFDKKKKDLYVQAAYRAIIDDPQGAPPKVMSILLPSGLDPKDIEEIHRTAILRRESAESVNHKQDERIWEKNAAPMDLQAREGKLSAPDILEAFKSGTIGPTQYYRLQGVVQSHGIESNEASQDLMYSILNKMYTKELTPDQTALAIQRSAGSIKPAHQTHAYATIASVGGGSEKIPATMTRAERLIATMVYPSLGSPSPKASEGKKYGVMMGELYNEYFTNKEKYHRDPEALIKWSMNRISPKAGGSSDIPGSPYGSNADLQSAFAYYVTQGKSNPNGATPKHYWQAWFTDAGLSMPAWPGGK